MNISNMCKRAAAGSTRSMVAADTVIAAILLTALALTPFFFGALSNTGRTILIVAIAVCGLAVLRVPARPATEVWWQRPETYWLFTVGIMLISTFTSASWLVSLEVLTLVVTAWLAFTIARAVAAARLRRACAWVLTTAGTGLAGYSLSLFATHTELRIVGPFKNSDGLGAWLLVPFVVSIALFARERRQWPRLSLAIAVLAIGTALFLTSSVGAGIALLAAAITGALAFKPRPTGRAVAATVLGLVLVISAGYLIRQTVVPAPASAPATVATGFFAGGASNSFHQRLSFIRSSLEMARDHPFTGVGPGMFRDYFPRYAESLLEHTSSPHSELADHLAEEGFLGLAAFGALLASALASALRFARRSTEPIDRSLAIGAVALAVAGAIDFSWIYPVMPVTFWVISGLLSRTDSDALSARRPLRATHTLIPIVAAGLAGLALIGYISASLTQTALSAGKRGDWIDAFGTASVAMRFQPRFDDELNLAAMRVAGARMENHWVVADEYTRRVIDHNPLQPTGYLLAGRVALQQQDFDRAESLYRTGLEHDPHFSPELALALTQLLFDQQRFLEAYESATTMIADIGIDVSTRAITMSKLETLAARAALEQGDQVNAHTHLDRARSLDPTNETANQLWQEQFDTL